MGSKKCQYCLEVNLIKLNEKFYCESCEVYYTVINGKQEFSNLPIGETDVINIADSLCKKCKTKYNTDKKIPCRTFNEYFKNLDICKKCKKENLKNIKNAFFKNFILYRCYRRIFPLRYLLFVSILFLFLKDYYIFNIITVNIIDYFRRQFSFFWNPIKSLCILQLDCYFHSWILCYFYSIFFILFSKNWVYDVPVNLDRTPDLRLRIEKLKLSSTKLT